MPIYIRGEDEDTLAQLRELGLDAQVVSDDPMGDIIFYLARTNAKLDNLGQLRHLHKIMQSIARIRVAAEDEQNYYKRRNDEDDLKLLRLKAIYNRLYEFTDLPENKTWRDNVPPFKMIYPKTEREVFRVFQCVADDLLRVNAIEEGMVYFKGVDNKPTLLGVEKHETTIRLLNI